MDTQGVNGSFNDILEEYVTAGLETLMFLCSISGAIFALDTKDRISFYETKIWFGCLKYICGQTGLLYTLLAQMFFLTSRRLKLCCHVTSSFIMKYYVSWVQRKAFVKVDNLKSREISDKELWYNTNKSEPICRKVPRTKQKPLLTEFLKKKKKWTLHLTGGKSLRKSSGNYLWSSLFLSFVFSTVCWSREICPRWRDCRVCFMK